MRRTRLCVCSVGDGEGVTLPSPAILLHPNRSARNQEDRRMLNRSFPLAWSDIDLTADAALRFRNPEHTLLKA